MCIYVHIYFWNCFSFHEGSFLFYWDVISFNYTKAAKKVITWTPQIHKYNGILWNRLIYVQCWSFGILPFCQIVHSCELKQLHSEKKNQFQRNDIRQMWGTAKNRCWGRPAVKGSRKRYLTPVWLDAHKKGVFPFHLLSWIISFHCLASHFRMKIIKGSSSKTPGSAGASSRTSALGIQQA